jgi:PAS domain S-box-containing protein
MKCLEQQDVDSHPLGMVLERWAAHTDLSVVIANAGGFVVWVNAAFTRMCGYNSDELLGRRPGHILSGALSGKRSREVLNRAIEQQIPVRTQDQHLFHRRVAEHQSGCEKTCQKD